MYVFCKLCFFLKLLKKLLSKTQNRNTKLRIFNSKSLSKKKPQQCSYDVRKEIQIDGKGKKAKGRELIGILSNR